jgi:4'-phosphopantetheinyl transferase superfamily
MMKIFIQYKTYNSDLDYLIDVSRNIIPSCWNLREGHYMKPSLFYKKILARLMLIDLIKMHHFPFEGRQAGFHEGKLMYEGISLSISYAQNMVVVAIASDGMLGVDIEKIENIDFEILQKEFTGDEWQQMINSLDFAETFYMYWTRKESALKADGRGLNLELSTFSTVAEYTILPFAHDTWNLISFRLLDYYLCSLATSKKPYRVQIGESHL